MWTRNLSDKYIFIILHDKTLIKDSVEFGEELFKLNHPYLSLFDVQKKQILIGLDRNPKAVAVMSLGTYRAGMEDTYLQDKEHYAIITAEKQKKIEEERALRKA